MEYALIGTGIKCGEVEILKCSCLFLYLIFYKGPNCVKGRPQREKMQTLSRRGQEVTFDLDVPLSEYVYPETAISSTILCNTCKYHSF